MRIGLPLLSGAVFAAAFTVAPLAFAQEEDDTWFEGDGKANVEAGPQAEEEGPVVVVEKRRRHRRGRTRVVVVDGGGDVEFDRGRGRRYRRVINAEEGEAPPPGWGVSYRSRKNLWIPGVTLLTTGWFASSLSSLVLMADPPRSCEYSYYSDYTVCTSSGNYGWGFAPLFGGYVVAGDSNVPGGIRAGFALMTIAQDLGLALTIAGAASKKRVFIRRAAGNEAPAEALKPELAVTPGMASLKMAF